MKPKLIDDSFTGYMDFPLEVEIKEAESILENISSGDFKKIIGRNFLHLLPGVEMQLHNFILILEDFFKLNLNKSFWDKIFRKRSQPPYIEAVYFEMNKFSSNTESWFVDIYAYNKKGTTDHLDWLNDFSYYSDKSIELTGFEDIQMEFGKLSMVERTLSPSERQAKKMCELLVFFRLQQLLFYVCKRSDYLYNIPVFVSTHGNKAIFKIEKSEHEIRQQLIIHPFGAGIQNQGKFYRFLQVYE